ncbi:hypothetical protein BH20ACI2_BH20ACI2_08500 [soil metagenome]
MDLGIIKQPGDIVGEVFISNIAFDVGRTPVACISMAITFRVLESSLTQSFQSPEIAMNAPWSNATGSPLPWTSYYILRPLTGA